MPRQTYTPSLRPSLPALQYIRATNVSNFSGSNCSDAYANTGHPTRNQHHQLHGVRAAVFGDPLVRAVAQMPDSPSLRLTLTPHGHLVLARDERICKQNHGLFPMPAEMRLSCSCPDGARMCKHVAAVLYGIGARFDHAPELLFRLRGVDEAELIVSAGQAAPLTKRGPAKGKRLAEEDLSAIFGLDMAENAPEGKPKRNGKVAAAAKKSKVRKLAAPAKARKQATGARKAK